MHALNVVPAVKSVYTAFGSVFGVTELLVSGVAEVLKLAGLAPVYSHFVPAVNLAPLTTSLGLVSDLYIGDSNRLELELTSVIVTCVVTRTSRSWLL